jgi:hypothetical protein
MIDVTKTDVAGVANPPVTPDGSQTSTLENLEANIASELGLPEAAPPAAPVTNTSTSAEPPATTVPPEPSAATEPEAADSDAEAEAKATRLSQANADMRIILTKFGVDPDSDVAEQLKSGLITVDELLRTRQPVTTAEPAKPDAAAPVVSLGQKLINLKNARSQLKGDVTAEQFYNLFDMQSEMITDLVKANQNFSQMQEDSALQSLLDKTVGATKTVFNDKVTSQIPDDVKEFGQSLFIGVTDIEVGSLAQKIGREKAFTPEGYTHVATQMAPKFDAFVQAVFKAGQRAGANAITNPNAPTGTPPINPVTPGGGSVPPTPPTDKNQFSLANLDKNVNAVLASTQIQV